MNETEELEQTENPEETLEESLETSETSETPPKKPMNPKVLGGIVVGAVAVVGLCVSLFSGGTTAKEMRLEKYSGSVILHNNTEEKEVLEGARLISQDNLETFSDSSAYIVLDDVKVLKADEETHMEVIKVNEDLDIELYKGSLYFSVTEPLEDSETLEFHTNNVVTGVRGTSGVITYTEDVLQSQVVVLSGTVEVVTIEEEPKSIQVKQGEVATAITGEDGSVMLMVEKQELRRSYFYSNHLLEDTEEGVPELLPWKEAYTQHLLDVEDYYWFDTTYPMSSSGGRGADLSATTYMLHDMDLDGIPELLLGIYYPADVPESGYQEFVTNILVYGLFEQGYDSTLGGRYLDYYYYSYAGSEKELSTESFLAVPSDGIGFYRQFFLHKGESWYNKFTIEFTEKGPDKIVWTDYWDNNSDDDPPLLDGTPIPHPSTWTHYTDLSGLEWNG